MTPGAIPMLAHLHVPKCAGGAVNQVLRERFAGRYLHGFPKDVEPALRAHVAAGTTGEIDVIMGHVLFGIQDIIDRPSICFSAVRDPISRICSYFNFVHTFPSLAAHKQIKMQLKDLNEITPERLRSIANFRVQWRNALCRAYTGNMRVNSAEWSDVWSLISSRIESGKLIVGDLDYITSWMRDMQILGDSEDLPKQKVTQVDRFNDYVVARPEMLTSKTVNRLRKWNEHDLRLMDKLSSMGLVG